MNELNPLEGAAIARAVKYFESTMEDAPKLPPIKTEFPTLRYRVRTAKQYQGWTRCCTFCDQVQSPNKSGQFGTDLHHCEPRNQTIEWLPSIGDNYV